MNIPWEQAPEGTTHVILVDGVFKGHWRRVADGLVHDWNHHKVWSPFDDEELWFKWHGPDIVARPPEEAPLPDGLQWPEGATHYNRRALAFFNNKELRYLMQRRLPEILWWGFSQADMDYWERHEDTVVRYAVGAKPKQEPAPVPKKSVGWWS